MNVFLWRKQQMFIKNKARLVIYILIPVIVLAMLYFRGMNQVYIGFSYIMISSCFLNFIVFSVEDLAFSEAILATPKTLKEIWVKNFWVNILYTLVIPFLYLVIYIMLFGNFKLKLFWALTFLAVLFSVALQLLSLVHFSDYSKSKQLIASVPSIFSIVYSVFIIYNNSIFILVMPISIFMVIIVVLSIIMIISSFFIFGKGSTEKMLINTKPLVNTVKDNSNLIVE